jgi:hypothetical protein
MRFNFKVPAIRKIAMAVSMTSIIALVPAVSALFPHF